MSKELLWAKIRQAREALGLSQTEIARLTNWSQASVSQMETGVHTFIPNDYLSMLAGRGINLTDLFDQSVTVEEFT